MMDFKVINYDFPLDITHCLKCSSYSHDHVELFGNLGVWEVTAWNQHSWIFHKSFSAYFTVFKFFEINVLCHISFGHVVDILVSIKIPDLIIIDFIVCVIFHVINIIKHTFWLLHHQFDPITESAFTILDLLTVFHIYVFHLFIIFKLVPDILDDFSEFSFFYNSIGLVDSTIELFLKEDINLIDEKNWRSELAKI